jgi:hypothetical protein
MKLLATLFCLALIPACAAPKAFEDMTPEEKAAYLEYQSKRVDVYLDFARANAEKFVAAGKWKQEDVNTAFALAEEAKNLYFIWKALGDKATLEQQYEARLALEKAVFKLIALGVDSALE